MDELILTSNFAPRTYPPLMLDNLQFVLPFTVENPNGTGSSIPLPPSLYHICQGRSIWVGASGNIVIGKFNFNSNGTKLLYGEIGRPYRAQLKNQNYFPEEAIPAVKEFLNLSQTEQIPEDLYRNQLNILFKRLDEVSKLLIREGFKVSWKTGLGGRLNRVKRLEICQDFLVTSDSRQLIRLMDSAVSECSEGEPLRSDVVRSKKFSRQSPFHSWDIRMSTSHLKGGQFQIKLYQKDLFIRLELVCLNVPIRNMPDGEVPFAWFQKQILTLADAGANYLRGITKRLLEAGLKIDDLDRAILIEGLKLYSPTLKYSDEAVRGFVDSIMDRQVYTPTAHRGFRIGRKSLANLSHPDLGICIKIVNASDKSNSFALRKDWKNQLERKKAVISIV